MSALKLLCYIRGNLIGEYEMRDLTEEELKLAPDWATHYTKTGNQVTFFNELKVQSSLGGELDDIIYDNNYGIESGDVRIPSKPFDITKHEFSDSSFQGGAYIADDGDLVIRASKCEIACFCANKNDAIAIAKTLGATAEDFK